MLKPVKPSALSRLAGACSLRQHVWSMGLGGGLQQRARDAALAPLGDVLVTGDFYGELDLGLGQALAAPPEGHGLFVARFDP